MTTVMSREGENYDSRMITMAVMAKMMTKMMMGMVMPEGAKMMLLLPSTWKHHLKYEKDDNIDYDDESDDSDDDDTNDDNK